MRAGLTPCDGGFGGEREDEGKERGHFPVLRPFCLCFPVHVEEVSWFLRGRPGRRRVGWSEEKNSCCSQVERRLNLRGFLEIF